MFFIPSDAQYCLFKKAQYDLFLQLATTQELNKIKGEIRSVLGIIKPMNSYHACINQAWGILTHNFGVRIIT